MPSGQVSKRHPVEGAGCVGTRQTHTGSEQSHDIKVVSNKNKDAKNRTGVDRFCESIQGMCEGENLKKTRKWRQQVSASPRF